MLISNDGFYHHPNLGRVVPVGLNETLIGQLTRISRAKGVITTFWAYKHNVWKTITLRYNRPASADLRKADDYSRLLYIIYSEELGNKFPEGEPMNDVLWASFFNQISDQIQVESKITKASGSSQLLHQCL